MKERKNERYTNLSWEGPDLGEEGLLGEVNEVILSILPFHDGAAVCGGELTFFLSRRHHQFGVLVLEPGERKDRTLSETVSCGRNGIFTIHITNWQKPLDWIA